MESKLDDQLDALYSSIRYRIISIICQTLLYGIYSCLVPIAIHVMVTNGLQSRSRKWLIVITLSIFALSTVHWVLSVVFTFPLINMWNSIARACYDMDNISICAFRIRAAVRTSIPSMLPMFDNILLINYLIADGVVVWRAWVLCSDESRVVLMIPVVMLAMNTVIYLMTVALRAAILNYQGVHTHLILLSPMIDSTQLALQTLSLLINICATATIALKAWKYRKLLMASGIGVRFSTQTIRILALLVESGVIYILIGVTVLASLVFFLRFGLQSLSDIFMPVGIQLVAMYPVVVALVVEQTRSRNSTYYSFGSLIDVHAAPMNFAPGPVLASGCQVDLGTKSPNADIHVTFDSELELGDVGMDSDAGSSKDSNSR